MKRRGNKEAGKYTIKPYDAHKQKFRKNVMEHENYKLLVNNLSPFNEKARGQTNNYNYN